MKRNRIGRTEVAVTEVALGCASLGNLFRRVEDDVAQDVLGHA